MLLKAITDKQIPGQPRNLKVLLLGQTRELTVEEAVGGLRVEEESVLQHVIRSDAVKERYNMEAKRKLSALHVWSNILTFNIVLSEGLDSQESDPSRPILAYRQVRHQRLLMKMEEIISFAERRSGARGNNARKTLIEAEDEVKDGKDG